MGKLVPPMVCIPHGISDCPLCTQGEKVTPAQIKALRDDWVATSKDPEFDRWARDTREARGVFITSPTPLPMVEIRPATRLQSRAEAWAEVLTNTFTGLVGSYAITYFGFKYIDSLTVASAVTVAGCTVWSIVRGYVIRRTFERRRK